MNKKQKIQNYLYPIECFYIIRPFDQNKNVSTYQQHFHKKKWQISKNVAYLPFQRKCNGGSRRIYLPLCSVLDILRKSQSFKSYCGIRAVNSKM